MSSAKFSFPSNVNVANFVSIKLTHKNFLLWQTQILGLIESQDVLGFITGTIPMPSSTIKTTKIGEPVNCLNPYFNAWKKSDGLLRGLITRSLSEEALGLAIGHKTSAEVWNTLTTTFVRESKERHFLLKRKLQTYQKQDKSITDT
uniref:Retrotransposon Copia-like N-terminal domain-containing protein n=1 Tax=Nymphaea colorata TaxID=210225 RepID=A0A5K0ZU65_9MAGN